MICLFAGQKVSAPAWASLSSCGEQGHSPVAVCGLLTVVASLVEEHGFQQTWHMGFTGCSSQASEHRVRSCGTRARLLYCLGSSQVRGQTRITGGFFTIEPPVLGSSQNTLLTFKKLIFFL